MLFFSSSCFGSNNSWREVRKVCDSCDRWLAATCLRCLLRRTNLFVVLEQGHWIKKEQVTISFLVWKFSLKLINSECLGEGGMLFKDSVWFFPRKRVKWTMSSSKLPQPSWRPWSESGFSWRRAVSSPCTHLPLTYVLQRPQWVPALSPSSGWVFLLLFQSLMFWFKLCVGSYLKNSRTYDCRLFWNLMKEDFFTKLVTLGFICLNRLLSWMLGLFVVQFQNFVYK